MTDTNIVRRWMRELGQLRGRAIKQGQGAASNDLLQGALTMCDALLRDLAGAHADCDKLRAHIQEREAAEDAFVNLMPVACLVTDSNSTILNANPAAASALNTNVRWLKTRQLVVYTEDREGFLLLLRRLRGDSQGRVEGTLRFRPRERKPRELQVVAVAHPAGPDGHWLWFLQPVVDQPATLRQPMLNVPAEASSSSLPI